MCPIADNRSFDGGKAKSTNQKKVISQKERLKGILVEALDC